MPVRYFEVSNSWNPGSAKLNTMSFIFWMFSCMASTSRPTSRLYWSSLGFGGAAGALAGAAGGGCGAAVSDTDTAAMQAIRTSRDVRMGPPTLQQGLGSGI